jgi:hypothetical protein
MKTLEAERREAAVAHQNPASNPASNPVVNPGPDQ